MTPPGGDCPFCGYSLRGIDPGTCPECGNAVTAESYAKARPTRLNTIAIAGLLISGLLLTVTVVLMPVGLMMFFGAWMLMVAIDSKGPHQRTMLWVLLVLGWAPILVVLGISLLWAVQYL